MIRGHRERESTTLCSDLTLGSHLSTFLSSTHPSSSSSSAKLARIQLNRISLSKMAARSVALRSLGVSSYSAGLDQDAGLIARRKAQQVDASKAVVAHLFVRKLGTRWGEKYDVKSTFFFFLGEGRIDGSTRRLSGQGKCNADSRARTCSPPPFGSLICIAIALLARMRWRKDG